MDKNDDDDDDEMVPHWFRQLEQYGIEPATEETDGNNCHEEVLKAQMLPTPFKTIQNKFKNETFPLFSKLLDTVEICQ